jgi:autotransporter translocation and assembly factor TamB
LAGGTLSGDLEARPLPGAWPAGFALKGQGGVEGLALPLGPGKPGLQELAARWRLDQSRLDLSDISAMAAGGRLKGKADIDLAAARLSLSASAKAADLGVLAGWSGAPAGLGLSGKADLDLFAFGPLSAPAATAALRAGGATWQGHPLTRVDLRAQLNAGRLQADGDLSWEGGQGSLSAAMVDGQLTGAAFKAQALPGDWLQAWAGGTLQGRLDGEGRYRRVAGGQAPWEASLRSADLLLRGTRVQGLALQASGDAKAARLRAEGSFEGWPGLNASGEVQAQRDGDWQLKNIKAYQREALLAQASGHWRPGLSGSAGTLDLEFKSGQVNVARLPGFFQAQGLSGSASAEGTVSLDAKGWRGALLVSAPGLQRHQSPLPLAQSALWPGGHQRDGLDAPGRGERRGRNRGVEGAGKRPPTGLAARPGQLAPRRQRPGQQLAL